MKCIAWENLYLFRSTGRPKLSVDVEDIEFLRSLRFKYVEIAKILGVSRATLYRRIDEEGLSECTFTDISDRNLDQVVIDIKQQHPNDGERLLIGHLATRKIVVPRTRVRESIHRVDPEGTALRRSIAIRRRVYHSSGPNAIWHIDGNHKLIRWRFVIHGGIDGYSRVAMFLKCSDNNCASTVLSCFSEAVDIHGLPESIRSDLGGENQDIWTYMVEQHSNAGAVITGSSTHNERIERLWRDVFRCVGILYHDTFTMLEQTGKLDPLNEVDLYSLHFIFLPRINDTLQSFIQSWNNHSLSTENNFTPNQLFIRGAIQQNVLPQHPTPTLSTATTPQPSQRVEVPRIKFNECARLQARLESTINPLGLSPDFGCSLYLQTISIVGRHLQNCSNCYMT